MARQQRIIAREYISELARLITEERWREVQKLTNKFTGIVIVWQMNKEYEQDAARKDGCESQRLAFKEKNKKLKCLTK